MCETEQRRVRVPSPTLDLTKSQLRHYVNRRRWQRAIHVLIALKRMGVNVAPARRSPAAVQNIPDDSEPVIPNPVRDAEVLPADLNDLLLSLSTSLAASADDDSVFDLPGDTGTVETVSNGHAINTVPNFRLPSRTTRGVVETETFAAASSSKVNEHHHHHKQQQQQQQPWQKHEGSQNLQFSNFSKTVTSLHITPVTSDSGCHGIQHPQQQQDQQQHDGLQNLSSPNCSTTVSSTEKIRTTGNNLHHPIHHPHRHQRQEQLEQHQQQQQQQQQQQTEGLQNLNLKFTNYSNTIGLMANNQFPPDTLENRRRQQQQETEELQKSKSLNYSNTVSLMTNDQFLPDPLENRRRRHRHHEQHQQQQRQQTEGQQNLNFESSNCSNTVSLTTSDQFRLDHVENRQHRHHHQHLEQEQLKQRDGLQKLNLEPLNSSNTVSLMPNDQVALDLDSLENRRRRRHHHRHHHRQNQQQQQQQEQQQKTTSDSWNNSTAMTLTDFTQPVGDIVPRSRGHATRRPPPPEQTSLLFHTPAPANPLYRTPTAVDGPPVLGAGEKMSVSMIGPGQTVQNNFVLSTLPRTKIQTSPNGEICQRQPLPSLAATQAGAAHPPSVNGRFDWLSTHHSATPTSKSKDATFIRDRVQFFTRNELAAAVAKNKSSDSGKTTSSSKTSWFRRALFR